MDFYDIILSILIIIFFITSIVFNKTITKMNNIQYNLVKYKCNPLFMPFSSFFGIDTKKNFTDCIQQIHTSTMPKFLDPIHYNLHASSVISDNLTKNINSSRFNISDIKDNITSITSIITNSILNVVSEFEILLTRINDLLKKIVAVFTTQLHLVESASMTTKSMWNGPPGSSVRFISSINI